MQRRTLLPFHTPHFLSRERKRGSPPPASPPPVGTRGQRGYSLLKENTPFVSPREERGESPSTPDIGRLQLEGLLSLRSGSAVYMASP